MPRPENQPRGSDKYGPAYRKCSHCGYVEFDIPSGSDDAHYEMCPRAEVDMVPTPYARLEWEPDTNEYFSIN